MNLGGLISPGSQGNSQSGGGKSCFLEMQGRGGGAHLSGLETILEGGLGEMEKKKESEKKRNYFGNLMSLVGNGKEKVGRREVKGI